MVRKLFFAVLVVMILMMCGAVLIFHGLTSAVSKSENKMKSLVGKKIVIKKDTLMIVDYSVMNNTCKLSDNSEISSVLAEKLVIDK